MKLVKESLHFALDCMAEDGEEIPPSDAADPWH